MTNWLNISFAAKPASKPFRTDRLVVWFIDRS